MATLNHVCMWDEGKKGWVRISAEKAAELFPWRTVSANSGLFMCEKCGQYVTLTDAGVNKRHFRHSSAEKAKNCPERTFKTGAKAYCYDAEGHELPLKIVISDQDFYFQIGFLKIPDAMQYSGLMIEIVISSPSPETYRYSVERLDPAGTTYLSVGEIPGKEYVLKLSDQIEGIHLYWPEIVSGVDPDGTFFEKETGKKVTYDADVEIGKSYYLLKKGSVSQNVEQVDIKEVLSKKIYQDTWRLYEVSAAGYGKDTARFFLDHHCRLTAKPAAIQPVWPVYTTDEYIIRHDKDSVMLHIKGDVSAHVSPGHIKGNHSLGDEKVVEIESTDRQQLVTAGRAGTLQYLYVWQGPLGGRPLSSRFEVSDIHGENVSSGIAYGLPPKRVLKVVSQYDGTVILKERGYIIEKRTLDPDRTLMIKGLKTGMEIQVVIGLDCIWQLRFAERPVRKSIDEEDILKKLWADKGEKMEAPRALANMALRLEGYPKLKEWIHQCVSDGVIYSHSYKLLRNLVLQAAKEN